jgi:hypothetical protein
MTDKPSKPKSESDLLALRVPEPSAPADLFGVREDDDKSVRALRWLAQIVGSGRFREIQRCDGNDSVVDPLEPAAKARIARVLNRTADALRVHAACDDARCASCGCRKWEHESAQKQPKQDCLCMSCGGWLAAAPPVGGGWHAIESAPICTNCGESAKPLQAYADFVGPFCDGCWDRLREHFTSDVICPICKHEHDRETLDCSGPLPPAPGAAPQE